MIERTLAPADLLVSTLGTPTVASPLALSTVSGDEIADYVPDGARILCNVKVSDDGRAPPSLAFEKAGPRQHIFFDPARTSAGIVTCGGLCPGINKVVRSMVLELRHKYGVARILGLRYGFSGLDPRSALPPMSLVPEDVRHVHRLGGSMLGVSRGAPSVADMVDELERLDLQILFTIGGDGTQRGAHAIATEIARRGLSIAVVGVPKTIDNDIPFLDKTFGYETAIEVAALEAASPRVITHSSSSPRVVLRRSSPRIATVMPPETCGSAAPSSISACACVMRSSLISSVLGFRSSSSTSIRATCSAVVRPTPATASSAMRLRGTPESRQRAFAARAALRPATSQPGEGDQCRPRGSRGGWRAAP